MTDETKYIGVIGVLVLIVGALLLISAVNDGTKIIVNDNLKTFKSYDELKTFVNQSNLYYYGNVERTLTTAENAAPSMKSEGSADSSLGSASEFSKTNIQIEGVDEPDIVKNDGKYIYSVAGNKVVIVEAYPADEMKIISEINANKSIRNIFINGDKLIIFVDDYNYYPLMEKSAMVEEKAMGLIPPRYSTPRTIVYVYDITDRKNPQLDEEFSATGNYYDARMINNYVYVVTSEYINLNYVNPPVFFSNGIERRISADEIYYFDNFDANYVFNSVMAINLNNGKMNNKVYLTGGTSGLFVSEDNIYLTYQKRIGYEDYARKLIEEVYLKVLPFDLSSEIKEIANKEDISYSDMNKVQNVFDKYLGSLEGNNKEEFIGRFYKLIEDFQISISKEIEKTVIHKINVDGTEINYENAGEVPGIVLNQFSMDENKGYFRIATTTGNSWDDTSLNHLYVLDNNLKIIGSVENLAQGERIYSARFIGERAYMVTFKQVDPLFVIDLSNPSNPEVLGYLKVTGFSTYLHPYDENHIIGIGREASEGGRAQGVKLALFDVSDVENPKEISKYEIKDGWSDSNALYDHKAFLFSKEKNLLVIPISHTQHIGGEYLYWQGAYVFNINLNGINFKGEISHNESDKYGNYNNAVQRSLYMDDVLYTISLSKIAANKINDLQDIKAIDLPYEEERYYGYGVAVDAVAEPSII